MENLGDLKNPESIISNLENLTSNGKRQDLELGSKAPHYKFGDNQINFSDMKPEDIMNKFKAFKNSSLHAIYFEHQVYSISFYYFQFFK